MDMPTSPGSGLTWDMARLMVEDASGTADLARIERGCAEDAVAALADSAEMHGRRSITRCLRATFAATKDDKPRKSLRGLMGEQLANIGDAPWEDGGTGKCTQAYGTEISHVCDGGLALWRARFSAWDRGGAPGTPVI